LIIIAANGWFARIAKLRKRLSLGFFMAGVGAWVLLRFFLDGPGQLQTMKLAGSMGVSITDSGQTNSRSGKPMGLLTLRNDGPDSLIRQQYYTLYWTNSESKAAYSFVSLGTDAVLKPGGSETVAVDPPACVGKWCSSFGFRLQPGEVTRFIQETPVLRFLAPRDFGHRFEQDDSYVGPMIDGVSTMTKIPGAAQTIGNSKRETTVP
jgi:hypothetical protein